MKNSLYILLFAILLSGCRTSRVSLVKEKATIVHSYADSDSAFTASSTIIDTHSSISASKDSTFTEDNTSIIESWDVTTTAWTDSAGVTHKETREKGTRRISANGKKVFSKEEYGHNNSISSSKDTISISSKNVHNKSLESTEKDTSNTKVSWGSPLPVLLLSVLALLTIYRIRKKFK